MTMKEIFIQFAGENHIPVGELKLEPEAPDQLYIRLDGENGCYEGHAMFLEEERMFIFYVVLGVRVPEEKREPVSAWLLNLNYSLKAGQFYIEEKTGELTARTAQYMAGADWEKRDLPETLVLGCGRTADHFYPEIMKQIFG